MKKLIQPLAFAAAFIVAGFFQSASAAGGPYVRSVCFYPAFFAESNFSAVLNQPGSDDVICLNIENTGRKNLSVTLHGPDGALLDNFFTGRRFVKMSKDYNFSGAEDGLYTITITDGIEKIKKQVKLSRVLVKSVSVLTVQ